MKVDRRADWGVCRHPVSLTRAYSVPVELGSNLLCTKCRHLYTLMKILSVGLSDIGADFDLL